MGQILICSQRETTLTEGVSAVVLFQDNMLNWDFKCITFYKLLWK